MPVAFTTRKSGRNLARLLQKQIVKKCEITINQLELYQRAPSNVRAVNSITLAAKRLTPN
jgi:hypothetical protein